MKSFLKFSAHESMSLRQKILYTLMNYWPPFLGAGISVDRVAKDFTEIDVSMKLKATNKNYVGTHYGGSLYSMTDPFYMLMLIQLLGRHYIVWDKAATIKFIKPGIGKVHARFRLSTEQIDQFKRELEIDKKIEPILWVDITDEKGDIVARVQKILYIKKKSEHKVAAGI